MKKVTSSVLARIAAIIIAAVVFISILPAGVFATGAINASEVTLYFVPSNYRSVLSLPSDKPSGFQLSVEGETIASCRVVSGSTCNVTADGLITAGNFAGDSIVDCFAGGTHYSVTVNVVNYATEYVDGLIMEYLTAHDYQSLSDMELMRLIASYPAQFPYGASSSPYDMVILGNGGSCWASTGLIRLECDLLGITSWTRNGNKDPGAGSGHRDAMAELNGVCYELEAGYVGNSIPRPYDVFVRNEMYLLAINSDGELNVRQYDGNPYTLTSLEIPSQMYGRTVGEIDSSFIHNSVLTSITLPSTVKKIGDYAFSYCTNLQTINIPASVTEIGINVFANDSSITQLTVDEGNQFYCAVDNCLFTKDMTRLLAAPSVSGDYRVPDGVSTIDKWAFYYNETVSSITVPASVQTISDNAFERAINATSIVFENGCAATIGNEAFLECRSLRDITFPSTVTTFSPNALYGIGSVYDPVSVHMQSITAPDLPEDFYLVNNRFITFYVPEGATGYDTGVWADLIVRTEPSSGDPGQGQTDPSGSGSAASEPSGGGAASTVPSGSSPSSQPTGGGTPATSPSGSGTEVSGTPAVQPSSGTGTTVPASQPSSGAVSGTPTLAPSTQPSGSGNTVPTTQPSGGSGSPVSSDTSSETGVAGFVERLYTIALGRASDPVGKADWIAAITERGNTGADAARGFLYSPEFLNKGLSDGEFVTVLYRTFFDREPDQAGFEAWVAALSGGASKQDVIEGFINSTEWANLCVYYGIAGGGTGVPNVEVEPNQGTIDFCTRLYTTCLNRDADQGGLMAWARQLANQRDTGTGAARGFFFSSEFLAQNVSNGEYVTRLYKTFMGREPDSAGYDAWVSQLDSGVSREEVFDGFAQSQEFTQICAQYGIIRGS